MAYEKRVCVLKQVKRGFTADGGALSGAVYCERLGGELTVTPRILGIAPVSEGRYVLVVHAEEKNLVFELKGNEALQVHDGPSVKKGFSVLLCFVRGEAEPVAFGACGVVPSDYAPLLSALVGEEEQKRDSSRKKDTAVRNKPENEETDGEDERAALPFRGGYNDEAIASSDYFLEDDAHAKGDGGDENQTEKVAGGGDPVQDAPDLVVRPRKSLTYYKEVRERLQEVMKKYPADERLKGTFPQSEWVKSDAALLGVVYEEGLPRYLCVAVEKTGDPPEEIKDVCALVPVAPFSEEAFWVVFQDADTGEYVKVYNA